MTAILFALLAGLCWGVGEMFTKAALHTREIGPITAIALRSTIALPVLWFAYAVTVHMTKMEVPPWTSARTTTFMKIVLGSGLIAGAAGMIFFYAALNLGEISRIKPIAFSVAPATAVILGWLVLKEPMTVQKAIAIVMIIAGVVLLTTNSSQSVGS